MNKIEFDFNKKNEIPYVKINREPTAYEKLGDALSSYAKKGVMSVVEKVAKEIAKCKDYERAMEFTKGIGNFLKENGVTPIISEIEDTKMTENAIGVTHVVHFEGLDFSEHDKMLENKIAKLESEISYLRNTVAQYKEDCVKLKTELESRGKINLNDEIKVKLTPLGAEIYYHQYDELNKQIKKNDGTGLEPIMPQIDKDGYTKFQLHHFISLYGEHIGMCKPNVITPLDIIIVD